MQRWEYERFVVTNPEAGDLISVNGKKVGMKIGLWLSQQGQGGWDLANVCASAPNVEVYVFKRPMSA